MTVHETRLWRRVRRAIAACLLLLLVLLVALECFILAGSHSSRDQAADAVLILGAMVYDSGPSEILQLRMETGLRWLRDHPEGIAVVCGGQGSNEPASEARTMADFLTASGVPPDRILQENRSRNTWENLRNGAALLTERGYDLKHTRVMVVSNGFHLTRVRMLARRCGLRIGTLAAPMPKIWTNTVYCYGREVLALIKSALLDRGAQAKVFAPLFSKKLAVGMGDSAPRGGTRHGIEYYVLRKIRGTTYV